MFLSHKFIAHGHHYRKKEKSLFCKAPKKLLYSLPHFFLYLTYILARGRTKKLNNTSFEQSHSFWSLSVGAEISTALTRALSSSSRFSLTLSVSPLFYVPLSAWDDSYEEERLFYLSIGVITPKRKRTVKWAPILKENNGTSLAGKLISSIHHLSKVMFLKKAALWMAFYGLICKGFVNLTFW